MIFWLKGILSSFVILKKQDVHRSDSVQCIAWLWAYGILSTSMKSVQTLVHISDLIKDGMNYVCTEIGAHLVTVGGQY